MFLSSSFLGKDKKKGTSEVAEKESVGLIFEGPDQQGQCVSLFSTLLRTLRNEDTADRSLPD